MKFQTLKDYLDSAVGQHAKNVQNHYGNGMVGYAFEFTKPGEGEMEVPHSVLQQFVQNGFLTDEIIEKLNASEYGGEMPTEVAPQYQNTVQSMKHLVEIAEAEDEDPDMWDDEDLEQLEDGLDYEEIQYQQKAQSKQNQQKETAEQGIEALVSLATGVLGGLISDKNPVKTILNGNGFDILKELLNSPEVKSIKDVLTNKEEIHKKISEAKDVLKEKVGSDKIQDLLTKGFNNILVEDPVEQQKALILLKQLKEEDHWEVANGNKGLLHKNGKISLVSRENYLLLTKRGQYGEPIEETKFGVELGEVYEKLKLAYKQTLSLLTEQESKRAKAKELEQFNSLFK